MSSMPSRDGGAPMDGDGDGAVIGRARVEARPNGSAAADISRAVVQLMARYSGRGPTRARTTLDPAGT